MCDLGTTSRPPTWVKILGKHCQERSWNVQEGDQQETNKRSFWRRTLLFTDSSGIIPWTHWRPILEVDYCQKRCLRIKLNIKFWFYTYEMGFGRCEVPRFLVSQADCSSKVATKENSPLKWWAPCSQVSRKKDKFVKSGQKPLYANVQKIYLLSLSSF